jgi:cytoskeletal protein CcmA (bactofilin family)
MNSKTIIRTTNQMTNQSHQDSNQESISRDTSIIGPNLTIKGDISGIEDLTIQGEIQGNVHLKNHNMTIEEKGSITADIWIKNITIKGSVNGNIQASGKVLIESKGHMTGDISASRISIMEGAQFKGSVKIISE